MDDNNENRQMLGVTAQQCDGHLMQSTHMKQTCFGVGGCVISVSNYLSLRSQASYLPEGLMLITLFRTGMTPPTAMLVMAS